MSKDAAAARASRPGRISLVARIPSEAEPRVVWVALLPEATYERVADAHRDGLLIEIEGELVRRGNQRHLVNVTSLTVHPPTD